MPIHDLLLFAAILFCGLTTGFVFAFTVVVMPGIRTLPDREFLSAFKVMWVGSVMFLIAAGVRCLDCSRRCFCWPLWHELV